MTNAKLKVEVWSDIMCPFCYIGKRRYETALAQFSQRERIETIWKSFQLDPSIPAAPAGDPNSAQGSVQRETVTQYLASRKGISYDQAKEMNDSVSEMARDAGLTYHLDKAIVANSFQAHRVIQMAGTQGRGEAAEEAFFRAYFTEGADIASAGALAAAGMQAGLTRENIDEALTSDEYANKVRQDIAEASALGITGVPFFVFNRKYAISGAQPAEVFLQTLEKAFAEWEREQASTPFDVTGGPACTPGGDCN